MIRIQSDRVLFRTGSVIRIKSDRVLFRTGSVISLISDRVLFVFKSERNSGLFSGELCSYMSKQMGYALRRRTTLEIYLGYNVFKPG